MNDLVSRPQALTHTDEVQVVTAEAGAVAHGDNSIAANNTGDRVVDADSNSDFDSDDAHETSIARAVAQARARARAGVGEPGPSAESATGDTVIADEVGAAAADADADADPERLDRALSGPPYSVFSRRMKIYIIVLVTMASFISPMTANIYFPAINTIATDLGVSVSLVNLTVTTYMIMQGIAPTLFGDIGDMVGRRPAFISALVIYLFVNIGLALQDSYAALVVLRMLQSTGSSGTLALGYAVVADISTSAERGSYMGFVGAGINVGPAISPVLGGILAQYLGWRSIFWFCFILSACIIVPYALTVPETSRNVVGDGSVPPPRWINMTIMDAVRLQRQRREWRRQHPDGAEGEWEASRPKPPPLILPNPLRTLKIFVEKDLALILALSAALYVVYNTCVTTISSIFADIYGLNNLEIGLCYLPYGVGCCLASILQGHLLDYNYRRTARRIGFTIDYKRGDDLSHFPIERARTEPMIPLLAVGLTAVIGYGWTLETRQPLAAPLVLLFVIGLTVTGAFSILNTLMMDLYPQAPATAVAAVNLARCLCAAAVISFIQVMLRHLGRGWTYTFWALLCVAMMPILWVLQRWGPQWREERRVRLSRKAEEKAEKKATKEAKKERLRLQQAADAATAGVATEKETTASARTPAAGTSAVAEKSHV